MGRFSSTRAKVSVLRGQQRREVLGSFVVGLAHSLEGLFSFFVGLAFINFLFMEMLEIEIETPSWLDGEAEVVYVSEVEVVYLFHLLELAPVKRLQVGEKRWLRLRSLPRGALLLLLRHKLLAFLVSSFSPSLLVSRHFFEAHLLVRWPDAGMHLDIETEAAVDMFLGESFDRQQPGAR